MKRFLTTEVGGTKLRGVDFKLKLKLQMLLVASVGVLMLRAAEGVIPITADGWEFDLRDGVFHYWGNVHVDAPGLMELTCEDLVAVMPEEGGRMDQLVATTNVVILVIRPPNRPGDEPVQIRATGQRAVYTATNQVVTLTGEPRLESMHGVATGERILYNMDTGKVRVLGNVRSRLNPDALRIPRDPSRAEVGSESEPKAP
jgi:lipopolysaccharide transport protein LptA